MKSIYFVILFSLIALCLSQKIDFSTIIEANHYVSNSNPFYPGTKRITFDLEITNGKAIIMALSAEDFELKKAGQSYKHYTFISDQPFSSLHMITAPLNFDRNFYILLISNNLIENIITSGYVRVDEVEITHSSNLLMILGIGLIFGGIIVPIVIGVYIYRKCCKKTSPVPYVIMTTITPAEDE